MGLKATETKQNHQSTSLTTTTNLHLFPDLDEDTIDAQALLFLIAGYETSSTVLSFAIHVMATHPELQRRLREHVTEVTDGKEMSYEVLAELHYLEAFLLGKKDLLGLLSTPCG